MNISKQTKRTMKTGFNILRLKLVFFCSLRLSINYETTRFSYSKNPCVFNEGNIKDQMHYIKLHVRRLQGRPL
jgi:hypothetical protein